MRHRIMPVTTTGAWRLLAVLVLWVGLVSVLVSALAPQALARGADRDRIAAFLNVTGFDVAVASIALSAETAPEWLGFSADEFGPDWSRVTAEVFAPDAMQAMALDILEQTLDPADLIHAVDFYAGDLGQRLVAIENAAHMDPDRAARAAEGAALVERLRAEDAARLALLQRMLDAIGSDDASVRAIEEIQLRTLLAASAAGVIELALDEDGLRAVMAEGRAALRQEIAALGLAGAALTYRDLSDAELLAYVEALEEPRMGRVYELLNAVQHEITADRFETLALRMAQLSPQTEL